MMQIYDEVLASRFKPLWQGADILQWNPGLRILVAHNSDARIGERKKK